MPLPNPYDANLGYDCLLVAVSDGDGVGLQNEYLFYQCRLTLTETPDMIEHSQMHSLSPQVDFIALFAGKRKNSLGGGTCTIYFRRSQICLELGLV